MKKKLTIVVMTIPLHGHINPMLGMVKELAAKGHTIYVYSTEEFKKPIESAGAIFKYSELFNYTSRFSPDIGKDALKITNLLLDLTEDNIDQVIELLSKHKADLVLHDGFCLWAKVAARALDIPAVSVITTVVFAPPLLTAFPAIAWEQLKHIFTHFSKTWALTKRYDNLLAKFAIPKTTIFDLFINQEKLNIVFTSRYFQPKGSEIGKEFMFIGPSLSGRTHLQEEKYDFKKKHKFFPYHRSFRLKIARCKNNIQLFLIYE
jgi:MGT family glycosyltransferase